MLVGWTKFSGIAPRFSPRRLAAGLGQKANNVDLTSRTVKAWSQAVTVLSGLAAGAASTIYRFGQGLVSDSQYWFHWTADVDVVKGAISGDQTERTFFTHPTLGPMVTNNGLALTGGSGTYPWNAYKLGVPAPATAPVAAVLAVGDTSSPSEDVYWCYTFVNSFGEEGPPSPVSNVVTRRTEGASQRLTSMQNVAPIGYNNITAKRIYRTQSGNIATEFLLVDEIPIAQAAYDDATHTDDLNEPIRTVTYLPPPAGAFGITSMANGIMLLFSGYDIWPSEAYMPYAYPLAYTLAVDYPIVGGDAVGSSAVILTAGCPYLLSGSDPSAMSLVKLDSPQACVSKRSIAAVTGGVAYASPDGLIVISTSGEVVNVTDASFGRKEWQALVPASIVGFHHDGKYIGFYNNGTTSGGFIHDPSGGDAAFSMIDMHATAGYSDLIQDALYLKVGTNIVKWNAGGAPMTAVWRSEIKELGAKVTLPCMKVRATVYPVTLKLFGNGALLHTETVMDESIFWTSGDVSYSNVEIELTVTHGEVVGVFMSNNPEELAVA